jgi:IS30 family transposase
MHDREPVAHLDRCAWDVNEVARVLGVHRATIYRRLRRLELGSAERSSVTNGVLPDAPASSVPRLRVS